MLSHPPNPLFTFSFLLCFLFPDPSDTELEKKISGKTMEDFSYCKYVIN